MDDETPVKVKEEEIPVEISIGGFLKKEDGLAQDCEDGTQIKVKEEQEEIPLRNNSRCKEEEVSMEIGADGLYTRSVVQNISEVSSCHLPKVLSREEKLEILKQKLLEKNRRPWVERGCFLSNPTRDPNNPDHMVDMDTHRVGHTDWCRCGNCIPLPTGQESVCCQEIREIRPHLRGISCVTRHPHFHYLCENQDFAEIHQRMVHGLRSKTPKEKDKSRALRKVAYQTFSMWIYGARSNQRQIPACTVHKVRAAFLSPDLGMSCDDYPAEYMTWESTK